MKTSLSPSFIFLSRPLFTATLLLISHCIIVQSDANDLIAQTCKNTPYYNLCVTSLTPVPTGSTTDVQGLALIMVDIVRGKASTTLEFINQELRRSPELAVTMQFQQPIDIPEAIIEAHNTEYAKSHQKNPKPAFPVIHSMRPQQEVG